MTRSFLFCGIGSIGLRHIGNLRTVTRERNIPFHLDVLRSSDRSLPDDLGGMIRDSYRCAQEIDRHYDGIFITNPTALHYETLSALRGKADSVFIEKPIFECLHDLEQLQLPKDRTYVAAPMRYHPVLLRIGEIIRDTGVLSARATCSSYLPDWRPGTDYRESYSAHRKLGGGVTLDLIHELDYLFWLFGAPDELYCIRKKCSQLEIDTDDIAVYIADTPCAVLSVHLDYFGRKPQRKLELWCHNDVLTADLLEGRIHSLCQGTAESLGIADLHLEEMRHFIDVVTGLAVSNHSAETALRVLKLALGV